MLKININDYFPENKNKSDYIGIFDPLNILLDVIGKAKQDLIEQSNFIPGANDGKESLEEFSGTHETHLQLNTKISMCSEFEDLIMDLKRQFEQRSEMYGKCLYTSVLNVRNREMGDGKNI